MADTRPTRYLSYSLPLPPIQISVLDQKMLIKARLLTTVRANDTATPSPKPTPRVGYTRCSRPLPHLVMDTVRSSDRKACSTASAPCRIPDSFRHAWSRGQTNGARSARTIDCEIWHYHRHGSRPLPTRKPVVPRPDDPTTRVRPPRSRAYAVLKWTVVTAVAGAAASVFVYMPQGGASGAGC